MKHRIIKLSAAAAAAIAIAGGSVTAALASGNAGSTQVTTFDPTGAQFTCPDATYTVLGGTVMQIAHDSLSPNGGEHVTGTIAPTGVTLTDGTSTYTLAGASWFGGNFDAATGTYEFTDTGFFNILGPSGGVVAKVATVEHSGSGGSNFSFDFGQCQEPQN